MNGYPRDMFEEMDGMFSRIFSRMHEELMAEGAGQYGYRIIIQGPGYPGSVPEIPSSLQETVAERHAEVHRIGDEVMVIAELPGVTMDAIRLDLKGTTLSIDADGPGIPCHATAELPAVDAESMQTTFRNGVLEVTFCVLSENQEKQK